MKEMKLDLSEIATTIGKSYHYEIKEGCADYEDLRCTEPITGSVDFTNTGRMIVARGSLSTTVELECSRCLERLTMSVDVKIDEQLPISSLQALIAGHEEELPEEEMEPLFENNVFDLSEFIRQMVLVQVPIKPLCSEACLGLCPTCGRNLNDGPCDCPVNVEASPFAALADILKDEGKRGEE